jgi:hypothetical protein
VGAEPALPRRAKEVADLVAFGLVLSYVGLNAASYAASQASTSSGRHAPLSFIYPSLK